MSSIPLPALQIRPPEQPNALATLQTMMQMKGMQQQQQMHAVELQKAQQQQKDQQAHTAAMSQWDGKDPDQLPDLILKNGGSGDAALSLKANILKQKQEKLTLDSATFEMQQKKNDLMLGGLKSVTDGPDEGLPDRLNAKVQEMTQQGLLDPQHAQMAQQIASTGDTKKIREALAPLEKGMMGQKEQFAQAQKERETVAKEQEAKTRAQQAATSATRLQAEMPGGALQSVDQKELSDFLAKNPGKGPMDFAAAKAKLAPQAQLIVANSQGGGLKDAALDNAAEKYWATGNLPPGGRGPAVMAQNQKIMNRAAELHSGESITEGSAAYSANKRSLESLQKNFDQVDAFERTAGKNLDVFLGTAQKVVDSGNPLINRPLRSIVGNMGGADQAAFEAARTTALTEISKVLNSSNASGVLSDSARHEVEALVKPNATLQQIVSAANILKTDMSNRHDSYQQQIDDIRGRMKGGGSKAAPATGMIRARDPQGKLHEAPAGTALPQGWTLEK